MFDRTFGIYLGENKPDFSAGFVVEDGFFCVLELNQEDAQNKLRIATEELRETVKSQVIGSSQTFEDLMLETVTKYKLSSFAASYFYQSQVFTFSLNAHIFLNRDSKLYLASKEEEVLSGNFLNLDSYIFITKSLKETLKHTDLKKIKFDQPKDGIEQIKSLFELGQGALLVVQTTLEEPIKDGKTEEIISSTLPTYKQSNKTKLSLLTEKINLRIIKMVVLLVVLLLVGYKTVTTVKTTLERKKDQALATELTKLESEYQQLDRALSKNPVSNIKNINNLNNEVDLLLQKYQQQEDKIKPLQTKINNLEKLYGNAKTSKEKVFFDLSLIDKKAQANLLSVTQNYIAIADNINKKAYSVSINNKNVSEVPYNKIKAAKLITEYNNDLFIYSSSQGFFKQENDQFIKIIDPDKTWGNFVDMVVFNGNIYALDKTKDEIFKFTPTSDGYGDKMSYFQPQQSINLNEAKSLAIDFSVYILSSEIFKFTAGNKDSFVVNNELDYSQMKQIYKNEDNNYLYLLDSVNSRVVILNDSGRLIKSIFNPLLKNSSYFGVYKDEKIIFLHKNKLYELDNF